MTCNEERCPAVPIRQSSIKSGDANFEAPKNGGVQRPSDHLDFGAHDPVVVFIGVDIEVCTLFGRHVAVCEAAEFGANEVCCHDFCGEKQLSNASVSFLERRHNERASPVN